VALDFERAGGPDIYRMLLDHAIDVVTFTSPSAVRNFVELLGEEPAADLLQRTVVASIGPVTAQAATEYNIHSTVVPTHYTIPALVDAIRSYFERAS
jgi:uroporphyrinogen III methyltransferase/synthase